MIRSADAKIAKGKASSDGEKWRIRGERKRFLQEHSAIIARRNLREGVEDVECRAL